MTFFMPQSRQKWFKDLDGVFACSKKQDEILIETFDFRGWLESGETISAVAWEENGANLSAESNTTTTATVTVAGSGSAEISITTSAGRKLQQDFRWIAKDYVSDDYV